VGFVFWNELPDELALIGAGLIVACGILLVFKELRMSCETRTPDRAS